MEKFLHSYSLRVVQVFFVKSAKKSSISAKGGKTQAFSFLIDQRNSKMANQMKNKGLISTAITGSEEG